MITREEVIKELREREIQAKQFLFENKYKPSDYWKLPNWLLQRLRTLSDRL